jgi:ATP-dependent DNA helicase RecQ
MATRYPITMEEMTNITGVGQGKAEKFGAPFLEAIKDYVEENEIERPDDMVVKSVVNKSGLKVYIIQCIDRKMPLEDIAGAKGKSVDEILEEIEHIVESGTKVNLDYILDSLLDDEYQEEIFDYFRDTEEDSIDEAMVEFEDVYSEEELRMMRIKFFSIMGN